MSRFTSASRRAQPSDEALQRRRLAPLVVEGEIEEFVERVVGFEAEPRQETPPPAAGAKNLRVEGERRFASGLLRQLVETRIGVGKSSLSPSLRASAARSDSGTAIPCDLEQLLVGKSEQRAAQHRRQRQIVFRQQECIGQRHQIHDRDVLGQHQAVGAGDLDMFVASKRE